jgi:hypothetical protein
MIYHSGGKLPSFFVYIFKHATSAKVPEAFYHLVTSINNLKACLPILLICQLEDA